MVAELEGRWRVASLCSESMGVDGLNWLPLKSIPHSEECDMPLQTLTQSRSLSVGALWRKSFSVAGSLAARHVSLVVNGGNKVTTLSAKPVFFCLFLAMDVGRTLHRPHRNITYSATARFFQGTVGHFVRRMAQGTEGHPAPAV